MKFGVVLPVEGPKATAGAVKAVARLAEEFGFHSVWATDRVLMPRSTPADYPYSEERGAVAFDPNRLWLEPLTTLSFAAGVTETILLGTNVLVLPYREPTVLAQEIASLDHLSGGRVLLGIGIGWMREEFEALGIDPSTRAARTEDWLTLMRELWSNRHAFALPAAGGRSVAPPVLIGGNSPAAFRRVARLGNGWVGVDLGPGETAAGINSILEHAAQHGRGRGDFTFSMRRRVESEVLQTGIDELIGDMTAYAEADVDVIVVDLLMTASITDALAQLAESLSQRGWLVRKEHAVACD